MALYCNNEFYKVIRYYVDSLDFEADHCLSKPFLLSSFLTCVAIDSCQPIIVYCLFVFFISLCVIVSPSPAVLVNIYFMFISITVIPAI